MQGPRVPTHRTGAQVCRLVHCVCCWPQDIGYGGSRGLEHPHQLRLGPSSLCDPLSLLVPGLRLSPGLTVPSAKAQEAGARRMRWSLSSALPSLLTCGPFTLGLRFLVHNPGESTSREGAQERMRLSAKVLARRACFRWQSVCHLCPHSLSLFLPCLVTRLLPS